MSVIAFQKYSKIAAIQNAIIVVVRRVRSRSIVLHRRKVCYACSSSGKVLRAVTPRRPHRRAERRRFGRRRQEAVVCVVGGFRHATGVPRLAPAVPRTTVRHAAQAHHFGQRTEVFVVIDSTPSPDPNEQRQDGAGSKKDRGKDRQSFSEGGYPLIIRRLVLVLVLILVGAKFCRRIARVGADLLVDPVRDRGHAGIDCVSYYRTASERRREQKVSWWPL